MNNITEEILTKINMGRTADVVYGHMKPIFDDISRATLNRLKSDFRTGKLDLTGVQSCLAQLTVIEDLEKRLISQMARVERALEKIENQKEIDL